MYFITSMKFLPKIYRENFFVCPEKKYRAKLRLTSTVIVVTFLKLYRYRYRCYFFSKVSVPISSLLLRPDLRLAYTNRRKVE